MHPSLDLLVCLMDWSLSFLSLSLSLSLVFPDRSRYAVTPRFVPSSSSTVQRNLSWTQHPHSVLDGDSNNGKMNKFEQPSKIAKTLITRTVVAFATLVLLQTSTAWAAGGSGAATAAAAVNKGKTIVETTEHLHTGQKIANFFMQFGLPKWAVLATISAMPVVELRGAIPVGIWLGMPITQVLPICVFGNMIPIVPLMFLLRNNALK